MSNTTKRVLLLLGITTVAAGGYIAYSVYKKKKAEASSIDCREEDYDDLEESCENVEVPEKFIFGDEIAKMPEATEVERTEYATKAALYSEENYPEEGPQDDDPDEELEESYESSKNYMDYRKKNKNKIIVLPESQIEYTWNREEGNDPENPDVVYEEEELYYFTEDDTLTDEDGNIIDEEQYLGSKPRQFGWFTSDKEDIYIRNNPLERDFRVNKVRAERSAYF